ncbi:MAG: S1/P1 nuclease [Steroidobacteraceae bacterium]
MSEAAHSRRYAAAICAMAACMALLCCACGPAFAWGDEGHEVIGLIADHYLEPAVRTRVQAILAGDATELTAKDIAHEAAWADKYRDSDRNTTKVRYEQTRNWHFVDLEIAGADLNSACFGRPPLAPGTAASAGPANDCVIDKIEEFSAELQNPGTGEQERRLALQFLLHFVGDLHQPLHAADDHDQGGNRKIVSAAGIAPNNLHHDWDTEFVARLGANSTDIAQRLLADITNSQRARWSAGTPAEWAMESFSVAKSHAYGLLPAPSTANHYELSAEYVSDATAVTAEQLSKAGVRLAFMLNQALQ